MATATAASKPAVRPSILVILITAAVLLNYVDRGAIGVAAPLMKEELALSATAFGVAVSAFFWVYAPVQLVIGWLCDRLCVYRLFGLGLAIWALSTTLTSLVSGMAMLILLRLFLGLGESVAFPGASKMIIRHVPNRRLGLANAGLAAAIAIGPALGTMVGAHIMETWGWRAMFAAFGLFTLLWLVPWYGAVRPVTRDRFTARTAPPFPAGKLLGQRALWAMAAGHFAGNYGMYFLLTWLPLYLVKSRGFSIEHMAVLATTLYVAQAVSAVFWGWLSDTLIDRGLTEAFVRKAMLTLSQVASAVCVLGIFWAPSEPALIAWLVGWGLAFSMGAPNLWATAQILAGRRAVGSWTGIQNCVGNLAGILGPPITGLIIDTSGSYMAAFALAAAVTGAGALAFGVALPRIRPLGIE